MVSSGFAHGGINLARQGTWTVVENVRRLAAIMFTDMVGFTAMTQADEANALALLDRHNRMLRPIFPRFHGREIKAIGDSFLVEFGSALEAAQCALEVQHCLHEYNASTPDSGKIRIRIGIHIGDVVQTEDDVLGDAVNIASRIYPLAEPEGVCVSQQVFDQVRNKLSVELVPLPPKDLKNVAFPLGVYRVVHPWAPSSTAAHPPQHPRHHRLAVLPLTNVSSGSNDEYFADGLTEELISVLSQLHDLRVIARTSVDQYRSRSKPVSVIGAELGVDSILEGSVRKADHRVRVCLQLVDVATQEPLWSRRFERELDDVFRIQAEVAERTAETLRLGLLETAQKPARKPPTSNSAAHDLYLKGLFAARQVSREGTEEALRCFEGATQLDPDFGLAYSSWANVYVVAAGNFLPPKDAFLCAKRLVDRALTLDPENSDAHLARGNLALQSDLDWGLAEQELSEAITLNPSNATAHAWYGILLVALQRFDEAKGEIRRALVLDPLWQFAWGWLVNAHAFSDDLGSATALAEQQRDRDPNSPFSHVHLGFLYARAGRMDDAGIELERISGTLDDEGRMGRATLRARLGDLNEARQLLAEWERRRPSDYVLPDLLAALYAAVGERAKALDLLEQDFREGSRFLWMFYLFPYFDGIRDDPRFTSLLRSYHLPVREESGASEEVVATA